MEKNANPFSLYLYNIDVYTYIYCRKGSLLMGVKNLKKRIITTGDWITGSHDLFTGFLMLTLKDIKYICVVRKRSVVVV